MRIKRHIERIHGFGNKGEREAKYTAISMMLEDHDRQSFWIGPDPRDPHLLLIIHGRYRCHIPVEEAKRRGIMDSIGEYSSPEYCPVR